MAKTGTQDVGSLIDQLDEEARTSLDSVSEQLHQIVAQNPEYLREHFDRILQLIRNRNAIVELEPALESVAIRHGAMTERMVPVVVAVLDDAASDLNDDERDALLDLLLAASKHQPKACLSVIDKIVSLLYSDRYRDDAIAVIEYIGQRRVKYARNVVSKFQDFSKEGDVPPPVQDAVMDITVTLNDWYFEIDEDARALLVKNLTNGYHAEAFDMVVDDLKSDAEFTANLIDEVTADPQERSEAYPSRVRLEFCIEAAIVHPDVAAGLGETVVPALFDSNLSKRAAQSVMRLAEANPAERESLTQLHVRLLMQDKDHAEVAIDSLVELIEAHPETVIPAFAEEVPGESKPIQVGHLTEQTEALLRALSIDNLESPGRAAIIETVSHREEYASELIRLVEEGAASTIDGFPTSEVLREGEIAVLKEVFTEAAIEDLLRGYLDGDERAQEVLDILIERDLMFCESGREVAVSGLDSDPEPAAQLINRMAKTHPAELISVVEALVEHLDIESSSVRRLLLDSITEITKESQNQVGGFAWRIAEELSAEETQIKLAATRAIEALEPYPIPTQLWTLRRSSDSALSSAASSAIDTLREAHRSALPRYDDSLSPSALVSYIDGDGWLKYGERSLYWDEAEIGPVDRAILEQVAERVRAGRSGAVMYPYQSPRTLVQLLLELLLLDGASDADERSVGVISPVYGHGRWGTFKDIQEELSNYGFATRTGTVDAATPVDELVGDARVEDGAIETEDQDALLGQLALLKNRDELRGTENLDAIVVNHVEKATEEPDELFDGLLEIYPDTPIILAFGLYTECRFEWSSSWNYPDELPTPPVELPEDVFSDAATALQTGWDPEDESRAIGCIDPSAVGLRHAGRLMDNTEITIRGVGDETLGERFEEVYGIATDLKSFDSHRVANSIFGVMYLLERLPVQPRTLDDWIVERRIEGETNLPTEIEDRLDELEELSRKRDHSEDAASIKQAVRTMDDIVGDLDQESPMLMLLTDTVEEAIEDETSVAVLCGSQWQRRILEEQIASLLDLETGLETVDEISFVRPMDARSLEVVDKLLLLGPPRPNLTHLSLLPQARSVEVLTYAARWEPYIEKYTSRAAEARYRHLGVEQPAIEITVDREHVEEMDDEDEAIEDDRRTAGESRTAVPDAEATPPSTADTTQSGPSRADANSTADLGEIFEDVLSGMDEEGETRERTGTSVMYAVHCQDGSTFRRGGSNRIMKLVDEGDDENYIWTSPRKLDGGDEILVMTGEARGELWRWWLSKRYSEEMTEAEVEKVLEGLSIWYEEVRAIVKEHAHDGGPGSDAYRQIFDRLDEAGLNRSYSAVQSWFESVWEAEEPLNLVTDSSLRIGPRQGTDILTIAEAFDKSRLKDRHRLVQGSMRTCRGFNRSEGDNFRSALVHMLEDSELDGVEDLVETHVVSSSEIVSNES